MSLLSEYEFKIKHIKGKENKVADALSRHTNLLFTIICYESNLENYILSTENFDKEYQILKEKAIEIEDNKIIKHISA